MKKGTLKYLAIAVFIGAFVAIIFRSDLFHTPGYWQQSIPSIGSSSSPRAVDLNKDGILDIVIGGGGREFTETQYGVIALDGENGSMLWSVPARNQVVGSPVFKDLNEDTFPDVIIGGRSAVLYAINGKTGTLFWEFLPSYDSMDIVNDTTILNFFTPQLIPDQDQDGLEDILTAYGGFVHAPPEQKDRPAGSLMVISSKSGIKLAQAYMPDGKETYMSPVVYDFEGNGEWSVLFGSGGETINGHFYKIDLKSILQEDLSKATILADGNGKGFIAPPVLADVNGDKVKDIIVNSVNGKVLCFDGATEKTIWETKLGDDLEGYTASSPGYFSDDKTPDFFISYGHGRWPDIDFAYQVVLDGKDGSIIFQDTAGTFQYASPLTFDFTEDGYDDALVVINYKKNQETGYASITYFANEMRVFDIHNQAEYVFHNQKPGSNLGSTPLLTDIDGDSYLDVIYCYMKDSRSFYSFKAAKIERIETDIKLASSIKWGEYMGPGYDGIF